MMPTIRIEDDVFEGLKLLAEPFVDTPNTVIRRLLATRNTLKSGRENPIPLMKDKEEKASVKVNRRGNLTPQSTYELFLLCCLQKANGEATKHDVTEAVITMMKSHGYIDAADLVKVQTGETKAANTIAWARNALKDRGLISQQSPRGVWALTEEGKAKAQQVVLPTKSDRS